MGTTLMGKLSKLSQSSSKKTECVMLLESYILTLTSGTQETNFP
jgi:hypothetical protein